MKNSEHKNVNQETLVEPQEVEQHPQPKTYHTNVEHTMRKLDSSPSSQHPDPKKIKQVPVDIVEEESMESFPASDPPAHHGTSNRPEPRRPGQPD